MNDIRKQYDESENSFDNRDEVGNRHQPPIETDLYGICEINPEGEIISVNPVLHAFLGYREGELNGRLIWELIESETDRKRLADSFSKIAEGEYASFRYSGQYKRKDGDNIDIEADWTRKTDGQGRATGFVSVVNDMAENPRDLEDIVQAAEERTENFDGKSDIVFEKFENAAQKDKIIEDLNQELRELRKSEKEKSEELQHLKGQKDVIEPLMLLLNEIQMQIDQVRDDIQGTPAAKGEEKTSELGEKMNEAFSQLSKISEADSETHLKIDDIRRKVDTLQEIVSVYLNEKPEPEKSYQLSSLVDTSSLIDLKLDRIQQQVDYFQQDFQEYKKHESEVKDVKMAESITWDDAAESMAQKLEVIQEQMHYLQGEFQTKVKVDAQKDKIIDNLHQELQEYKGDIQKKLLQSMIMDIIQIIDNIRKLTSHYASKDPSENDPEKLLKLLESIPSDLEDIFLWQGIKPFTCNSDTFDPARQRVLKKLETGDKEKDKSVAESIRPGYEWDGKVIRPEMVAAYIYKEIPDENEVRSSDE